jgi:hypothetical protein
MKQISISTDVFAKIWSLRNDGEESEDDILRRVLSTVATFQTVPSENQIDGFFDKRSAVTFSEGFEIFRTYKGMEYRAVATKGAWKLLNDGSLHKSLNALNQAIVNGSENVWVSWNYVGSDGGTHRIGRLRNAERISHRENKSMTISHSTSSMIWRDDVRKALEQLEGKAHLDEIYRRVRELRTSRAATLPQSLAAIVRRELEYNSSDSESYQGRHDLFYSVQGIGNGVWGLR